ncbi:MAG: hypothetical protein F6K47_24775 [Symploca sp. SIO2E6]|nr:hypothetical protein [Symploca sp. SIO2E6]
MSSGSGCKVGNWELGIGNRIVSPIQLRARSTPHYSLLITHYSLLKTHARANRLFLFQQTLSG